MIIPFGEYRPDVSALSPGSTALAKNVLPGPDGSYLPWPSAALMISPISAEIRGVISVRALDRTNYLYAATAQKIMQMAGRNWIDRGTGYSMTGSEMWSFAQFRDRVIAVSAENPVLWSVINSASFSPMIASVRVPRARHVAVVNREWVVLGNVIDPVDGERPGRVWWLARGDPTKAGPDTLIQADFEDMDAWDGEVQGIVGFEYGVVICRRAIWRMTYEGGDVGFRFDKMVTNKGATAPGSIVSFGRLVFFWDRDGPYVFDGTAATPIGDGKIATTFVSLLNQNSRQWISSTVIPRQTVVVWALPTHRDFADRLLAYNWVTKQWSFAEIEAERIFGTYSQPMFTDDPSVADAMIDGMPYASWPLDGEQFQGGVESMAMFAPDHSLRFFNGPPMEATIDTAELALAGQKRVSITKVRPMVDGAATAMVSIGSRDTLGETERYSPEAGLNLIGHANLFAQGRFIRARVRLPSGFAHALGVDIDFTQEGLL